MRIKEFSITEYGPLSQITKLKLDGFTVVYGKNEEGKSLIVESLLKMLYQGKSEQRAFDRMKRVDRNPSGYILLEYDGKEEKYPECGSLGDLHEISSEICRKIFVIQDSDLRIDEESNFYGQISDKLLGLSTSKIEDIKNVLQNVGQYTGSGRLKDTQGDDNHLRKRHEDAKKIADEIQEYIESSDDQLNNDVRLAADISRLAESKSKIDLLQKSQKRDVFEKSQNILKKYEELLGDRKELSGYSQDERDEWLGVEGKLKDSNKALAKQQELVDQKTQECKKAKPVYEKEQAAEEEQKNLSERIKTQLQPLIYQYDDAAIKGAAVQDTDMLKKIGILSGVATLITSILSFFNPWIALLAAGSLLVTLYSVRGMRKGSVDTSSPDYKLKQLQVAAQNFGLESTSAAEIKQYANKVEKDFEKARTTAQEAKNNAEAGENSLKEAQDALADIETNIKLLEKNIIELRKSSNLDKVEDYTQKLKEQQEIENQLSGVKSALQQLLGEAPSGDEALFWKDKLQDFARFKNEAEDVEFDETLLVEQNRERDELELQIEETTELVKGTKETLRDFERRVNQCLEGENYDYVTVEFVEDLKSLADELHRFTDAINTRVEACRLAEDILDEVKAEQQGKMEDMFEGTSDILSKITSGEYTGLGFDDSRSMVVVEKKDGTQIDATHLSKGTYDQLYLAVRINLSQKLLADQKGFFIMDDPFLSSDGYRLKEQLDVLTNLADDGWQIIYFTAKDEVRDAAVKKDCRLIELPLSA